jgi:predicted membrane chloride channel (bestrophin family)
MDKHSKWPIFMRLHGSVMPKMILPMLVVAIWSTIITCISKFVHNRQLTRTLFNRREQLLTL